MERVWTISSILGVVMFLCVSEVMSANKCTSVSDCMCGYHCVDTDTRTPCNSSSTSCRCREGCVVGNMFIKPGRMWQEAYCNLCSCLDDPSFTKGIPMCTRSRWCGMTRDMSVYAENPSCNERRKPDKVIDRVDATD